MSSTVPPRFFLPKGSETSSPRGNPLRAKQHRSRFVQLGIASISAGCLLAAFHVAPAYGATATVGLGSAAPFAVLASSTVTNTGATTLHGNLGLHPGTSITGFPPGLVTGTKHVADGVALNAKNALTAAYVDAAGRPSSGSISADLAGSTLTPGVYTATSSMGLTGAVTLDGGGNPNAVFIFQAGSTLTTGSASRVNLIGKAQPCNVFWQVGSSATIGTTTHFVGTILAKASISFNNGATLEGRALARTGAVTLIHNTITVPTCATVGTTTTSATGTSTTSPTGTTTLPNNATTTVPVIPNGSPGTGFGGTAQHQSALAQILGAIAAVIAVLSGTLALVSRRRRLMRRS